MGREGHEESRRRLSAVILAAARGGHLQLAMQKTHTLLGPKCCAFRFRTNKNADHGQHAADTRQGCLLLLIPNSSEQHEGITNPTICRQSAKIYNPWMPSDNFFEIACPSCHTVRAVFSDEADPIRCLACETLLDRAHASAPQRVKTSGKEASKPIHGKQASLGSTVGGVLGFIIVAVGVMLIFGFLGARGIDVFHMYISEPTPPPGGYRTVLDVPPAQWPFVVDFVAACIGAKAGAVLVRRIRHSAR